MKTPRILPLLIGASTLLSTQFTTAQSDATDPVGVVTIEAAGDGSLTLMSVPRRASDVFSGSVESVAASTIVFDNASFQTGEFATPESPNFLFVNSGEESGSFFLITGNSVNSVEVDSRGLNISDIISENSTARIIPANTISSVFGSGESSILDSNNRSSSADNIIVWDGERWQRFWLRSDGNWYSNLTGATTQNNFILYPDEGFFLRNVGSEISISFTGSVPIGQQLISVAGGGALSLKTHQFPVDVSFSQLGLQGSANWTANNRSANADQIIMWDGQRWQRFWVRSNGFWYSNLTGTEVQNETRIPSGSAFFVRYLTSTGDTEAEFFTQPPYNL